MDPDDPFASMDPETIRRGSMRTLRAMFPELFGPEPDAAPEPGTVPPVQSGERPARVDEYEETDPQADEDQMEQRAGSMDG